MNLSINNKNNYQKTCIINLLIKIKEINIKIIKRKLCQKISKKNNIKEDI